MLRIYNSLTRRKEAFRSIRKNEVRIYVCGMTVYDFCHLGHARVMLVFDTVVRYLKFSGYRVFYVRNITDIDDKIIDRANEQGIEIGELTARFIEFMNDDLDELAVLKPDAEPRATEYVPQIIEMIETLIDRDYAYAAENGDVYYRTRNFDEYGKLSGKRLDELMVGARVEPDESKLDPLDFVLWKNSKEGEPWWESPWGRGRPGWHIECSAMSTCLLGGHFDIHGGGMDLMFPHHENEIAQSRGASDDGFANVWMHNGYLQIDSEKMSKSLHNFLTIREVLDEDELRHRAGEILRFFYLGSHYRSPLNYSDEAHDQAKAALTRIYTALNKANVAGATASSEVDSATIDSFRAAMDDDFNTPEALAVLFEAVRKLNRAIESGDLKTVATFSNTTMLLGQTLGILSLAPAEFLGIGTSEGDDAEIERKVDQRRIARQNREWQLADHIRSELSAQGIEIEDLADGTTIWRRL